MSEQVRIIMPDGTEIKVDAIAAILTVEENGEEKIGNLLYGSYCMEDLLMLMLNFSTLIGRSAAEMQRKRMQDIERDFLDELVQRFRGYDAKPH